LSIDIKDGSVIPNGENPSEFLSSVADTPFEGFIILNISSVGTECGIDLEFVKTLRAVTKKPLFYGGGVRSVEDLKVLADAGFDGAIVSTAVHKGAIPLSLIQEGEYC